MPVCKRPTRKSVEALWSECVKARAGYKSEYSGKDQGPICSHHIFGKPNYSLRFDLDNGICITNGEHSWIAHNPNRATEFMLCASTIRKVDPEVMILKGKTAGGCDLWAVHAYLKMKLKEFKRDAHT